MNYFDLHTHTVMSDGSETPQGLLAAAQAQGYGLGISDHLFCEKIFTLREVQNYLDELDRYDVFKGVEANIGENFTLPPTLGSRVDYVIASAHAVPDLDGGTLRLGQYFGARAGEAGVLYHRTFSKGEATHYLQQILRMYEFDFANQRVDILGHCTVTPFYDALAGDAFLPDWENAVIALCKKYRVAMEISTLWRCPQEDMLRRAHAAGIAFSLGSDCHLPKDSCKLGYSVEMLQTVGIGEQDLFVPRKA